MNHNCESINTKGNRVLFLRSTIKESETYHIPELYLLLHERIWRHCYPQTFLKQKQVRRSLGIVGHVPRNKANKVLNELKKYGLVKSYNSNEYELVRIIEDI